MLMTDEERRQYYAWANSLPKPVPHVEAIANSIAMWNDGLLTTREFMWRVIDEYTMAYMKGHESPNYPVPTIPLTVDFISYGPEFIHIDSLEYGEDDPQLVAIYDGSSEPMPHRPEYYHWCGERGSD